MKLFSLINCLLDYKIRYIPLTTTLINWFKNQKRSYTTYKEEDIRNKVKTSDTIFILGGSESINDITDEQWEHIGQHDSIGINWWPIHKFVPTYYYTNYPRDKFAFNKYLEVLSPRILNEYLDTIFFISGNRAARRGIHPRVIPSLFPNNAKCYFYTHSNPIRKKSIVSFNEDDFRQGSLVYRGALSIVVDLIDKISGYNKIVLLGVDLKNRMHFYDSDPKMEWQLETGYRGSSTITALRESKNQSEIGDKHPLSEYVYALNSLYYKPNGISLYIGSDKSILSDQIPVYKFNEVK